MTRCTRGLRAPQGRAGTTAALLLWESYRTFLAPVTTHCGWRFDSNRLLVKLQYAWRY
jgi:hypothetical protein